MTDIIFSFVLQYKFEELESIFESIFNDKKEFYEKINTDKQFVDEYNQKYEQLKKCLYRENKLKRDDKYDYNPSEDSYSKNEKEILDFLEIIRKKFEDCLKEEKYKYKKEREQQTDYDKIYDINEKLKKTNPYNDNSDLKEISGEFDEILKNSDYKPELGDINANAYTYFLQVIGTRIRHHGNIEYSKEFTGTHMFAIARRANDFIKAIRHINGKDKSTFICLDAIRNPYEASYFQDRYASFYLVAVSTDNDERIRRLSKNNYTNDQINALDDTEYPSKLKGDKKFTNQDIGACSQLADIYLYNPNEETKEKYFLSKLVVKYITLIKHPGLITPSSVERCMQIAYNAKLNSGCLSRQVGAVITDSSYSVKAVGWNSVPEGQVPCNLRSVDNYIHNKDVSSFSTYEIADDEFSNHLHDKYAAIIDSQKKKYVDKLKGRLLPYCFKDEYEEITKQKNQVHTRSLHAEENAFLQIVKYGGESIKDGNLFTSASSCVLCSKKAFQLGIKHIYYIDPYTDIANSHILSFGKDKSKCPQCHLFYGAIGRAYTCLYTQRIPIKDELKSLIFDDEN